MPPAKPNFLKAAFQKSLNATVVRVSALGCGIAAIAAGDALLLGLLPGIEVLYLAITVNLPSFRKEVRARHDAERKSAEQRERQEKLDRALTELSSNQRACFLELNALTEKTLACYARMPSGGLLVASSEVQLHSLLDVFLKLLSALNGYRRYLDNTNRQQLERELAALRVELSSPPEKVSLASVRSLQERRVRLLEVRLSQFDKAIAGRELISHQLASIEECIRLMHDQALTLRDPELATLQLEDLAHQLEVTDETIREMESFNAVTEGFAQFEYLETLPDMQPVR